MKSSLWASFYRPNTWILEKLHNKGIFGSPEIEFQVLKVMLNSPYHAVFISSRYLSGLAPSPTHAFQLGTSQDPCWLCYHCGARPCQSPWLGSLSSLPPYTSAVHTLCWHILLKTTSALEILMSCLDLGPLSQDLAVPLWENFLPLVFSFLIRKIRVEHEWYHHFLSSFPGLTFCESAGFPSCFFYPHTTTSLC